MTIRTYAFCASHVYFVYHTCISSVTRAFWALIRGFLYVTSAFYASHAHSVIIYKIVRKLHIFKRN